MSDRPPNFQLPSRNVRLRRGMTLPHFAVAAASDLSHRFVEELDEFGVVVLDTRGQIIDWNAGAERLLGFCANDIRGRHLSCLYPAQDIAAGRPDFDLKQARCKNKLDCDGWRVRKNGSPIFVHCAVRRLLDRQSHLRGYGLLLAELPRRSAGTMAVAHAEAAHLPMSPISNGARTDALVRANALLQSEVADRRRIERELLQSQTLLRELAAHQDQIKEDERKRIAREIHDDLGQNLLALRLDASMLLVRSGRNHPNLSEKIEGSLRQIDEIMTAVRSIINNLRPGVLDFGLHAAVEWQVREFQRRSNIVCDLVFDRREFDIDDHRATALFRILQESLTNIKRHAQATRVSIILQRDDKRLSLSIADNGIGLRPGCRRKANSFGLVGIAERISRLGGELTIDSARGRGTTLRMSIPMVYEFSEQ